MNAVFSIKKLLIGIVITVVLFITITLVINSSAFDESLNPEVVKSLEPVQMPADEENAYFAVLGLSASADKNIIKVGRQLIDQYYHNRDHNNLDEITTEDYKRILGGSHLNDGWQDLIKSCTARKEFGCTSKLYQQLNDNPINDSRLTMMLARYEQVTQMTKYQSVDHLTFASPLPNYGTLMKLRRIKLAYAYGSTNPQDFLRYVEKDLKFWKLLLSQGDTLIDKMIAIVSIWESVYATSEFIRSHEQLSQQELALIDVILLPLTKQQLDLGPAFVFEQREFYLTLKTIDPDQLGLSSGPVSWLVQLNATVNDYNQHFIQPIVNLSKLSAKDLAKKVKTIEEGQTSCCFNEIDNLVSFSPSSLYNLGGKLLLSTTHFNPQDYIARVHDLNGVIQLVRFQLEIINNNEQKPGVTIEKLEFTSPYDNKPIYYDPVNGFIGFKCLDKGSVCNIRIH